VSAAPRRTPARRAPALLSAAALGLACAAPAPTLVQIGEGRPAMGTVLEITLVASDAVEARDAIARCFAETERLEAIFTTWREDGELALLNARAGQGPQPASPELVRILLDARRLSRDTGGTFDVSVGPVVSLWREAERRGRLPSDAELAAARSRIGAQAFTVDEAAARVALATGAAIDLGGLAKGWTLDRLGELLARRGIDRALLNFGGSSLLALGPPLDGAFWRAAVEEGPVLALLDTSVSISSSFGQHFAVEGRELAHIVDPRTGAPLERRQRAIVIAADGASAEAWSKAFVVLPPGDSARGLLRAGEIEVNVDGVEPAVRTPGFDRYVAAEAAP
jgi:thiamine biosynthesis lipoprotein